MLVADKDVKVLVPRGSSERLTAQIVYQGPVAAPVQEGAQIAKLRITRGKALVLETPLHYARVEHFRRGVIGVYRHSRARDSHQPPLRGTAAATAAVEQAVHVLRKAFGGHNV